MLRELDDPDLGPMIQHNVMWRMSQTPGAIRFTGRGHGQDTDVVLRDLGLSAETIADLRERGVVT